MDGTACEFFVNFVVENFQPGTKYPAAILMGFINSLILLLLSSFGLHSVSSDCHALGSFHFYPAASINC